MRVVLGNFLRFGLEANFGSDLAIGIQAALLHYTRRLRSGRAPVAPPCFDWADLAEAGEPATVELAIEQDILAMLREEARRRRVSVNRVMNHAVFVYLADLDASGPSGSGGWWQVPDPTYH